MFVYDTLPPQPGKVHFDSDEQVVFDTLLGLSRETVFVNSDVERFVELGKIALDEVHAQFEQTGLEVALEAAKVILTLSEDWPAGHGLTRAFNRGITQRLLDLANPVPVGVAS